MKEISFPILSACLISLGAVLAVWGVLLDNPRGYINASYIGSDRPGMIVALSDPTVVNNYMRYRNKAILSLVLIVLGFFVGLPVFSHMKVSYMLILLLILLFLVFSVVVAGRTRKNIIEKWHERDCQISWFMKILDESHYRGEYKKWKKTNQGSEFLGNTLKHFEHIAIALDIDIETHTVANSVSPENVDSIRRNLKTQIEEKGLFYYFLKPKKLLSAYK